MSNVTPLTIIPFKDSSSATLLTAVCMLFMFLSFLSFSAYKLFQPPETLYRAAATPGYVLIFPSAFQVKGIEGPATKAETLIQEMVANMDNVLTVRRFMMQDYTKSLPFLLPNTAKRVFDEILLVPGHRRMVGAGLNEQQFRQDIASMLPGTKIQTRKQFFGGWIAELKQASYSFLILAGIMFVGLVMTSLILLRAAFHQQAHTVQTLYYLGAHKQFILKQFQTFFTKRFFLGGTVGISFASLLFIPIASLVAPNFSLESTVVEGIINVIVFLSGSYALLTLGVRGLIATQLQRMA
jgi:hypothetical protein